MSAASRDRRSGEMPAAGTAPGDRSLREREKDGLLQAPRTVIDMLLRLEAEEINAMLARNQHQLKRAVSELARLENERDQLERAAAQKAEAKP